MLSIANLPISMSDTAIDTQNPPPEEILEDGEIDDEEEEEIVTEETFVTEEVATESVESSLANVQQTNNDCSGRSTSVARSDSVAKDQDDDDDSAEEDKKKSHKKHQRKRRKHRDSKERELRALEKKERRRKRKLQTNDDGSDPTYEHGGSVSPQGRKRRKRKKHSKDRKDRDSTTPDSNASDENNYASAYYGSQTTANGYGNEYSTNTDTYGATDSTLVQGESYNNNNSSSTYYTKTTKDQADANYDSYSESGSDFESQLASYQNYKVHGEPEVDFSKESSKYKERRRRKDGDRSKKSTKMSTVEKETRPHTNEMYEEFMDYEENQMRVCKFYAEGKCLKGNECSFSHDLTSHQQRSSKITRRELCKYYLAGHCHHGDQCTYMHGEYPCKYFHTGATCYAADKCRFSHEPATEETQEIIDNLKDVLGGVDDSWEISELAKVGIKPLEKPPPGMGLLPTPDIPPSTAANNTNTIPSIFDISVVPSADFQKRIDDNSVASLSMTDESEGTSEVQNSHHKQKFSKYPSLFMNPVEAVSLPLVQGGGLLPTPVAMPIAQNQQVSNMQQQQQTSDGFYDNFYEGEHYIGATDNKFDADVQSKPEKSDDDVIKTEDEFIRIDNSATTDEDNVPEKEIKAPDFLPATQKALFLRIHHKRPSSDSDKGSNKENLKIKESDGWTYSSDDEEKTPPPDAGIIKIDHDAPPTSSQSSTTSVESILKMIASKQGGNSANVDTNLLSKVASVINMPATTTTASEHYNPASTYNPAQPIKASPNRSNSNTTTHQSHHRERKSSGSSSSTSPGHSTKLNKPKRRRLSTQELTKEPTIIPLVAKQSGNQPLHSAHPDPRMTLSRLLGAKSTRYSATLPQFSRDLILPGSGKLIGLKITLSSDESKATTKRDPRLGRHKDPRLQRSSDPRLKSRSVAKTLTSSVPTEIKSSVPIKPSALLTKTSAVIPSLPELDLNLANMNNSAKENVESAIVTTPVITSASSYSLPNLKLPRLMKAPAASPSPSRDIVPNASPARESSVNVPPPTIAPYDPRYMSSGPAKSAASDLSNVASYDPRILSGHSSLPAGMELKKRTIQLPKLTPAPSYKPTESSDKVSEPMGTTIKPEGDQGDF